MKALVTGGAGFVGSHLVDLLIAGKHDVAVYDLEPARNLGARSAIADLFSSERLEQEVLGQDVVFHFAAHAQPHGGALFPTLDLEQNVIATARLLEAMRASGVKRLVFASSSSIYGNTSVFPTPEDAPLPQQTSLYGASKLAAEALISAYVRSFGMQATIFRFAPMLGEGYKRGHVVDFWQKLKAHPEEIEILGDGQQRRSYVYVKDAMAAVLFGTTRAECAVDIFNVSADKTATVDESLTWICEEMGVNPRRIYTAESWAGDKAMTLLDTSRLRALGWRPNVSIKDAVQRTVRSFE